MEGYMSDPRLKKREKAWLKLLAEQVSTDLFLSFFLISKTFSFSLFMIFINSPFQLTSGL